MNLKQNNIQIYNILHLKYNIKRTITLYDGPYTIHVGCDNIIF